MTKQEIKSYIAEELANEEPEIYLDADDYKVILEALSAEPCEDTVSRKDVHDMLENLPVTVEHKWFNWLQMACIRLADLPPVKPQPKTGHWIIVDDCEKFIAKCSVCGRVEDSRMVHKYPYCHCGAKMESEENNADSN